MIKLSVVIIAFNEESNIGDCIDSVKNVADEVVVIDSNSIDKTEEIARSNGAVIFQKPFESYVDQKNYATDCATYDHVLSIDADERLSADLENSIQNVKSNWSCDGYSVNRKNFYGQKWIRYGGWYPDVKLRLYRKDSAEWTGKILHESLTLYEGKKACHLDGDLLHYTYKNKEDHFSRSRKYSKLGAQANRDRGFVSLIAKLLFSPIFKFIKQFILQFGFLDGYKGWLIARVSFSETAGKYWGAIKLKMQ